MSVDIAGLSGPAAFAAGCIHGLAYGGSPCQL